MAAIILPRRHYKQPAGELVIAPEWARECRGVFSPANATVAQKTLHTISAYEDGAAIHHTSVATGAANAASFRVSNSRIIAGLDNSTAVAFISRRGLTTSGQGRPVYCERSESRDIFKFGLHTSTLERAGFVFRNSSGQLINNATSVDFDTSKTSNFLAYIVNGTASRTIYADGNYTTNTTGIHNSVDHCNNVTLGSDTTTGTENFNGGIFFVAVFGRSMSFDELDELNRNPWQLFRADPVRIYSLAAATIPTLSLPGVTDITATSARPQVTLTY